MDAYNDLLSGADPDLRRRNRRRRILWAGKLRVGEHLIDCQVRNISLGGALIKISIPLAVDTLIYFESEHHSPLQGRIAWQANSLAGVSFDSPANAVARILGPAAGTLGLSFD